MNPKERGQKPRSPGPEEPEKKPEPIRPKDLVPIKEHLSPIGTFCRGSQGTVISTEPLFIECTTCHSKSVVYDAHASN